jgi:peptidoglycan hydrolase CwlO-like protein
VRPNRTLIRFRALSALVVTGCLGAALVTSIGAGADPLPAGDATVTALRQQADAASKQYFDALAQSQALATQVATIEAKLPELEAKRQKLRVSAEHRAAVAYTHSGSTQLAAIVSSDNALDAARRALWLEQLNARDNTSLRSLQRVSAQLEAERTQLHNAQQQQKAALDQLQAQGAAIDAKLQAAESRQRALQAAAAAAAAIAAAAAAPQAGGAAPPAAAPIAPPSYQPTPGVHPQHDQPFLVCTRNLESGGRYNAVSSSGTYMGAYQFSQPTWNSTANHAGRPALIGVPPNTASQYDQDDLAWTLYQWQGSRPWGGRCG